MAKNEQKEPEQKAPEQEAEVVAPKEVKAAKPKTVPGIRVVTKVDGFRRGGRAWTGATIVPCAAFTAQQLTDIAAEPMLMVSDCEIEV